MIKITKCPDCGGSLKEETDDDQKFGTKEYRLICETPYHIMLKTIEFVSDSYMYHICFINLDHYNNYQIAFDFVTNKLVFNDMREDHEFSQSIISQNVDLDFDIDDNFISNFKSKYILFI